MTLSLAGYTLGANRPLNHARILWQPITGTIAAGGTNGALAANDLTAQRWACGALPSNWTLTAPANVNVDTVFIAAHNLGSTGSTVLVQTAAAVGGPYTTRATIVPTDNDTIAVMINNAGTPYVVREVRIQVTGSSPDATIGIIRAGVALQMERPFYGGHAPLNWNRATEAEPQVTEGGQWAGQIVRRISQKAEYSWEHLTQAWYEANFEPFAKTLPSRPFGIIGNPSRLGAADVGWCWTGQDVAPALMGVRDFVAVSLPVTGYAG